MDEENIARGIAFERTNAGEHFVEEDAEREDVGASIDGLSRRLLGRHIVQRSDDNPLFGLCGGRTLTAHRESTHGLGQTEVQHPHPTVVAQHHVVGLQVTVRYAFLMRRSDSVSERYRDVEEFVQRESVLGQKLCQGLAANELHRDEVNAVGFFDGEHLDDVRVIECG